VGDGNNPVQTITDDLLHEQRVIKNSIHLLFQGGGLLEPGGPINGEGVVQRRDYGNSQKFPQKHPIA
jgi:hypothetical protein